MSGWNRAKVVITKLWRLVEQLWRRAPLPQFIKDHLLAIGQLLLIWFTSNLPVLASAIIKTSTTEHERFWPVLFGTLHGGEVYIYAAALIAPFWWTLIDASRQKKQIGFVWIPVVLAIVITLVGSIFYSMATAKALKNDEFVNPIAIYLYFGAIAVWYWSIYADRRLSVEAPFKKERREIDGLVTALRRDNP